ncbi:12402_t:CDS:2, partial [Dentiscutata erythropus]
QDIKHVGVCGSSTNFPAKNLSNIRLVCFVCGEAEEDIFPIVIDNNTTVENLGVEIRNVRRDLNQKNFDLYVGKFKQINRALVNTVNTTEKRQGELMEPPNNVGKRSRGYWALANQKVDHVADEPISELKEAIKTKKPQTFANVDANDIKLWKLNISDDLSLEDGDELLAINDIGDYWPTSPPKKHIH